MTSEWKTLKELWDENGQKPFDAVRKDGETMHVVGIAPSGSTVGWGKSGFAASRASDFPEWELHKPKKKITLYPALFKSGQDYIITNTLFENEGAVRKYAMGMCSFVKLLTDRGVEVEVEE